MVRLYLGGYYLLLLVKGPMIYIEIKLEEKKPNGKLRHEIKILESMKLPYHFGVPTLRTYGHHSGYVSVVTTICSPSRVRTE